MPIVKIEFPLTDNEACAAPYWMILDPGKGILADDDGNISAAGIVGMISGPFFSRAEADAYLESQRHNFSWKAVVWSCFGRSKIYQRAWQKAFMESEREKESAPCPKK